MMNKKQLVIQIDNPTHYNKKKERNTALKVLEKAKLLSLNRKIVFLQKGYSTEFEKFKKTIKKRKFI